jgi:hypothetical protein
MDTREHAMFALRKLTRFDSRLWKAPWVRQGVIITLNEKRELLKDCIEGDDWMSSEHAFSCVFETAHGALFGSLVEREREGPAISAQRLIRERTLEEVGVDLEEERFLSGEYPIPSRPLMLLGLVWEMRCTMHFMILADFQGPDREEAKTAIVGLPLEAKKRRWRDHSDLIVLCDLIDEIRSEFFPNESME